MLLRNVGFICKLLDVSVYFVPAYQPCEQFWC